MDALNKRLERMARKAEHAVERAKRKSAGYIPTGELF